MKPDAYDLLTERMTMNRRRFSAFSGVMMLLSAAVCLGLTVFPIPAYAAEQTVTPSGSVMETDGSYQLEAELPGVSEDQISVQVDHDILTISADVNMDKQDKQYMHSERRWGHMERSFELEGVDQDGIRASLDNGILRSTLPKIHPVTQEVRKIAIGHAGSDTPKLAEGTRSSKFLRKSSPRPKRYFTSCRVCS